MSLNKESQLGFSYTLRGLVSREVIYSSSSPTMYGFQRIKFVFRFSFVERTCTASSECAWANGGPPSIDESVSRSRKKIYLSFSYFKGITEKAQKGRTCHLEEEVNRAKIQPMAESEGANGLFSQKDLPLYGIEELLSGIHLLSGSKQFSVSETFRTRCVFFRIGTVLFWMAVLFFEVTLYSTLHCV